MFTRRSFQRMRVVPGGRHVGAGNADLRCGRHIRYGRLINATSMAIHATIR